MLATPITIPEMWFTSTPAGRRDYTAVLSCCGRRPQRTRRGRVRTTIVSCKRRNHEPAVDKVGRSSLVQGSGRRRLEMRRGSTAHEELIGELLASRNMERRLRAQIVLQVGEGPRQWRGGCPAGRRSRCRVACSRARRAERTRTRKYSPAGIPGTVPGRRFTGIHKAIPDPHA